MRQNVVLAVFIWGSCAAAPTSVTPVTEPVERASRLPADADPCAIALVSLDCPPTAELRRSSRSTESESLVCEAVCVVDGIDNGPYQSVEFEDVPVVVTGSYYMGRKTGTWQTHLRSVDGPLREEVTYLHGPRHGRYVTFFTDGSPHISGSFYRELRDGRWTESATDGVVLVEGAFSRGKPIGTHLRRHPNGTVAAETRYDESGRPDGEWCSWLADGTKIECTEFRDGNGVEHQFDAEGALVNEQPWGAGLKHGLQRAVSDDITLETTWSEGKQTGPQREHKNGCLLVERTLLDGRLDGPFARHNCDSSGSVEVEVGAYCAGQRCGLWIERDAATNGVIRITEYDALSMKLAEAGFDAEGKLNDFWTMDDRLRLPRAACYQAIAGGLCCEISGDMYTVNTDCMPAPVDTTEL